MARASSSPRPAPDEVFDLLAGTGVLLPRGAGVLRFGMSEQAAQRTVAGLADVRPAWICGTVWAFTAEYEGIDLLVCGEPANGTSECGITGVCLSRCHRVLGPSAVPVVLDGVDLFGYPAVEVLRALRPRPCPGMRLPTKIEGDYLADVWVYPPEAGVAAG